MAVDHHVLMTGSLLQPTTLSALSSTGQPACHLLLELLMLLLAHLICKELLLLLCKQENKMEDAAKGGKDDEI